MNKKILLMTLLCWLQWGSIVAEDVPIRHSLSATQQKKTASGVVVSNETGETIIGATVQIKGTTTGAITDVDGQFTIPCSLNDVLVISCIGYKTQEIKVESQSKLMIKLSEDSHALQEIVVTAFGTGQKKESVVGSIQTVRPNDLKVPSASLSTSFAGRLAGVVAVQKSGMPGSNGADFYIRGISTISGITSPLIILDGMEVGSYELNALDPEVIESFSILKDATATAMYGTRGANGVMIVKTKSGKDTEKPIIGFRLEGNVTTPTKTPKFVDGIRYMQLYNEAVTSQGTGDVLFTSKEMAATRDGLNPFIYPNVDWYNEIFKEAAFNQKANFNIRGGTKKITYFMNITANHETGMLKNRSKDFFSYDSNIDLMKYTFQNNIDFHMSKSSTISLHLNAQLSSMSSPAASMEGLYGAIMDSNPADFPINYPNTGETWIKWGTVLQGNDALFVNPMAEATKGYSDSFSSVINANLDFKQDLNFITKGLKFNAMFSFKNWSTTTTTRSQNYNKYGLSDYKQNEDGTYELEVTPIGTPEQPVLGTGRTYGGDRRMYFLTSLGYERSFEDHHVSGLALVNLDEYSVNIGDGLLNSLPKRKLGYAFRASYDYAHRYMIEFNAGYNGSENFAEGHRFGFFPSVAVGWNISEEKFWEPLRNIVSYLKLRSSYGLVGNDQIGGDRFIYMADVALKGSPSYTTGYGTNKYTLSGPSYSRYQNNAITWEVGRKLNIGAEIQLFNSFNITVDIFKEIRSNIFQQRQSIPNYFGTAKTVIYGNLAKVKNQGADFAIDYGKQITKDFSMQFKSTFTYARNQVTEYDQAAGKRYANSRIGHPVHAIYGFMSNGLYIDKNDINKNPTSTLGNIAIAPGDIKYLDQPDNAGIYDGKIDMDDKVAMGYPTIPEIVYGFGPSMSYRNWDFSFFFQGTARVSFMMGGFHPFGTQKNRNVLKFVADDYWSESNQNPDAKYPRLTKFDNSHNSQSSDFWLRNGSFLKLKNAELGYSFKNTRIYINGSNLLTFSPFKLWDPEMGGGAGLSYPTQRTFNIGIQVTLNNN